MKAQIELDIGEMMELERYHYDLFKRIDSLPKDRQDQQTLAGWPLRETGQKHLQRSREIRNIIDEVWPK